MKTILIIEDEAGFRLLLHTILAPNYNIFEASNGREGLRLLTEQKPDLVITDLKMPGVTDFEIIRSIRARDSKVKIIACSGRFNQGTIDNLALKAGADLCLPKPVSLAGLEQSVIDLLYKS